MTAREMETTKAEGCAAINAEGGGGFYLATRMTYPSIHHAFTSPNRFATAFCR